MHTNYTNKDIKKSRGFTLVEMLVVLAIIAILASVVLYSATKYINKGRDATIKGNLAILVTAGEVWYDKNGSTYAGFCGSNDVTKALNETPTATTDEKCNVNSAGTAWAVCAKEFENNIKAYCVDSKGNQKDINNSDCSSQITNCCFGAPNCIP